jgi:hypothetical protein
LCANVFQMSVYPLLEPGRDPASLADPAQRAQIARAREQAALGGFQPVVS